MMESYIEWLTFQQKLKYVSIISKATQAFFDDYELRLFEGYPFEFTEL